MTSIWDSAENLNAYKEQELNTLDILKSSNSTYDVMNNRNTLNFHPVNSKMNSMYSTRLSLIVSDSYNSNTPKYK